MTKKKLTELEVQNIRLQAQNEILYEMIQKDYYIKDKKLWIDFKRIKEEAENCDSIDEFLEWLKDVEEYMWISIGGFYEKK